jgi:hypothetical protein
LGASSYVQKPYDFTALVDTLKVLGKYWLETVELPLRERNLSSLARRSVNDLANPGKDKDEAKLINDRRKDVRFRVKDGALISPASKRRRYWKMIDVSRGGASFRYISSDDLPTSTLLDIATRDVDFFLHNVRYRSISDIELNEPSSLLKLRRHSVEFIRLTDLQKELLGLFIKQHTVNSIH